MRVRDEERERMKQLLFTMMKCCTAICLCLCCAFVTFLQLVFFPIEKAWDGKLKRKPTPSSLSISLFSLYFLSIFSSLSLHPTIMDMISSPSFLPLVDCTNWFLVHFLRMPSSKYISTCGVSLSASYSLPLLSFSYSCSLVFLSVSLSFPYFFRFKSMKTDDDEVEIFSL